MIVIKTPKTKEDFTAYYNLRYKVLREPWGQSRGTEKDDYEPISEHLMAIDDQTGKVYGVVKLFEKEPGIAQFSHMAVLKDKQGTGIGKMLIEAVEALARQKGYTKIGAMSRLTTTHYFDRFGYLIKGIPSAYFSTFQMAWMEKSLEPEDDASLPSAGE